MVHGGEGWEGVGETGDWGWHIWGLGLGLGRLGLGRDDKAQPSWDRSMYTAWTDPSTAVCTVRRVNRRVVSNELTMEDEKASDR